VDVKYLIAAPGLEGETFSADGRSEIFIDEIFASSELFFKELRSLRRCPKKEAVPPG
jgi:hypothetical protein